MADKESELYQHNLKVLNNLDIGDLVEFGSDVFNHWAVYVGNGYVIHLVTKDERKSFLQGVSSQLRRCTSLLGSGSSSRLSDAASSTEGFIWKQRFFDVAEKRRAKKNNLLDGNFPSLEPKEIVDRAESMLDEKRLESMEDGTRREMSINGMNGDKMFYDVFRNNCEHFATWCRYGVPTSVQAEKAVERLKSLVTGVGIGVGVGVAGVGVARVAAGALVAGGMVVLKWMFK